MTSTLQPYREPVWATLARTGAIAVIAGAVVARLTGGGLSRWPAATLLMLWPSLGGHFLELFFLNWLRPRLPSTREAHVAMRLAIWFAGGVALLMAMRVTALALWHLQPARQPAWWIGGLAFVGIELVVHLILQLRGRPSFLNGRG